VHPSSATLLPTAQFTPDMISILTGCHSLIVLDKLILGDPVEKIFFEQSEWDYQNKCVSFYSGMGDYGIVVF
jgi:hypothetical protein